MKKKPKRYEIDSFKKLCNIINEDNFEALTTDLVMWLTYHVHMMREIRKMNPEITKGKSNWEISATSFIWINDGEHKMEGVNVKDQTTGEVTFFKFSEKTSTTGTEQPEQPK